MRQSDNQRPSQIGHKHLQYAFGNKAPSALPSLTPNVVDSYNLKKRDIIELSHITVKMP